MSSFDTTLNAISTSLNAPTAEQVNDGAHPFVEIAVEVGAILPFSQGQGGPPLVARTGTYRYSLEREVAIEFFKKGLEAAEALPAKPSIPIASDLSGVEQAAERLAKIKGGR